MIVDIDNKKQLATLTKVSVAMNYDKPTYLDVTADKVELYDVNHKVALVYKHYNSKHNTLSMNKIITLLN